MTSSLVVESLGLSEDQWSMSYQSRLGPVKWLTPSTSQMVKKLAGEGRKKLIIASPAFIVDGLETLEELDIGIRECFNEHGGEKMTVVKCLNDNQDWIKGLESMIMKVFEKARN
jgi:ferrochelatase